MVGGNPTIIQPHLGQAKSGQSDSEKGVIRYLSARSKCHGSTHTDNGHIRSYSVSAEPLRRWLDKSFKLGFLSGGMMRLAWPRFDIHLPTQYCNVFFLIMQRSISTNAVFGAPQYR